MPETMLSDDDSKKEPKPDEETRSSHCKDVTAHLHGQNEAVDSTSALEQVVEVQQELEQCLKSWGKGTPTKMGNSEAEEQLNKELDIDQLPSYHEELNNIFGIVVQRLTSTIEVDTKYGQLTVELDSIEADFKPRTGDKITLVCLMQPSEHYEHEQGEILKVKKIFPTIIEWLQRCTVERVFEQFIVLTDNVYVLKEDLPHGTQLHLDDVVSAELIESKYSKYSRRAIKLTLLAKNSSLNISPNDEEAVIAIDGKEHFVYTELGTTHKITFKVKNLEECDFVLNNIEIHNPEDTQLSVLEPIGTRRILMDDQITIIFEIHTKFIGESREFFTLNFDLFKITRSVTIIVCKSEDEAIAAERRLADVIQGEGLARFARIKYDEYDVTDKICELVLKSEILSLVKDRLLAECPLLDQELSFSNHEHSFAAMLHLEEIELHIAFRNYNRERARLNHEGYYLPLFLENLAERGPAFALGDTVHPWPKINIGAYDVFKNPMHKVFSDRIYLSFNSMFQTTYDSEDSCLEFDFSKFGFCKQHAMSDVCKRLGESFLFTSKVCKRKPVQLEVNFKDDNMHLCNKKLSWFNPSLNSIQKVAVCNILRGETENMPYVICGPPGTGKTVPLVETILQLVRNVPSARLLVGTATNSATDLITKLIIASNVLAQGELVRLVSQNRFGKGLIPPGYEGKCATLTMGIMGSIHESMIVTSTGWKLRCQPNFLLKRRITISAYSMLGSLVKMRFLPEHFAHVPIDEAGPYTEGEIMKPIVLLHKECSQVVLAGDPHQLQPVLQSRYASGLGLGVSFLLRLHQPSYRKNIQQFLQSCGYNPSLLMKLLNNYWALPYIVGVYSKLFYDRELVPMVSDQDSRESQLLAGLQSIFGPHHGMPRSNSIFFHRLIGDDIRGIYSPLWKNLTEARGMCRLTILMCRRNILPKQIGILTPYTKQVKTLRRMFSILDMPTPKFGSVEQFQGQERDIMLISTVYSIPPFIMPEMAESQSNDLDTEGTWI